MASLGAPIKTRQVVTYFGIAAEKFKDEVRDHYLKDLNFELATMRLMAVAYDIRFSKSIYVYPSHLISSIEHTACGAQDCHGQFVAQGMESGLHSR